MAGWTFPLPAVVRKAEPQSTWSLDQGVDIPAPAHTALIAVGSGTIVRHGITGFGNDAPVLKLDNGGGYVYYGHAGPGNRVKDGTHVSAGDIIGEVGAGIVGISTGPHLEIGLSDVAGTPLKGQAGNVKSLLTGASNPGKTDPVTSTVTGVASDVNTGASDAITAAVTAAVKGVLNDLWDSISSQAAYGGLFAVLVLGGVALFVIGALRTSGHHQEAPA